jgi:4-amino-4-deoxy-L-arabinose transferase-like glycosyltransferase
MKLLSLKKNRFFFLCFLLVFVSLFFRLYNLKKLFFFMVDESTANLVAKRIFVDHRLILLGPDIPGGLHTGPLFYYLTGLIMFFSNFNPIGEAIFASLLGTICLVLILFIGKKLFNSRNIAFFAGIIYAFSNLIIIHNRVYNTLTFTLLASLLTYYSLFQLKKGDKRFAWLLGLALVLGTHSEGSAFSLVLLSILFFIVNNFPKKKESRLLVFLILAVSFLPLVFFDLRHGFVLSQRFARFFSFSNAKSLPGIIGFKNIGTIVLVLPQVLSRIFFLTGKPDLSCQILPCSYCFKQTRGNYSYFYLVFSFVVFLYFIVRFFKEKKNFGLQIIGLHFFSMIIGLGLYNLFLPNYLFEWLFVVFFPGFCFISAYFLNFLWVKFRPLVFIFLGLFMIVNINSFFKLKNPWSLFYKEKAIKYALNQVNNRDYYLDTLGSCFGYGGYRYLFWFYGQEPVYSYADDLYWDWLYPRPAKPRPSLGVVIVNPTTEEPDEFYQKYNQYKQNMIARKRFAEIEVMIVKESEN